MEIPEMRIEILAGTANVVRFPVERLVRPTLDLMREIAPDVREVLLIATYIRVEEAEGVARAVGFARRGEVRSPRDLRADEEVVFGPAVRRAG
jgi:hypothetical protein